MKSRGKQRFGIFLIIFTLILTVVTPGNYQAAQKAASVGNKQYSTLDEAIGKVKNGQTVKLLRNISTNRTIYTNRNVKYTLDLNRKTIRYTGKNELFYNKKGKLTIKNGTINAGEYDVAVIRAKASLNIVNGTYKGGFVNSGKLQIYNGKFSSNYNNIVVNSGTCKIKNGTFYSTADNYVLFSNYGKKFTIENGKFVAENTVVVRNNKGVFDIKNGSFQAKNNRTIWQNGGVMNISGGKFTNKNYTVIDQTDGTLNVKGGTIESTASYQLAIKSEKAKLNISGGTIRSKTFAPLGFSSELSVCIKGGTIESALAYEWYNTIGIFGFDKSKLKITGGTIIQAGKVIQY